MYILPDLPYAYDALEPFIDEATLHFHHDKHHQAYCDKTNALLKNYPDLAEKPIEHLIKMLPSLPKELYDSLKNQGGGFLNHNFYFSILKKGTSPNGKILDAIIKNFGSFDSFKKVFTELSIGLFGSGYLWLVKNKEKLELLALPNQDSPLTSGKTPLLTIDLWEHAYYLKYQNRRADYVANFFNIINWDKVEELFTK